MGEQEGTGAVILYASDDGQQRVQLRASGGTAWLSQTQLAELYGTSVPNIAQLIRRIIADGEVPSSTINSELSVRTEGTRQVQREVKFYNLDMILAIGYRVTTPRAVQFRQWATTVLKEYLVKGFAMNDGYLKDPAGTDYFDELLERIRSIRASEKRFYQKVREIFAKTSADYDSRSDTARTFFATIQNKLIYAVAGRTAAELVLERADSSSANMGLTNWAGQQVKRSDAETAKNYLTADEVTELDRLTVMFLDFAEDRARRRQQTLMADWVAQADRFLDFNNRRRTEDAELALEEEAHDLNELLRTAGAVDTSTHDRDDSSGREI